MTDSPPSPATPPGGEIPAEEKPVRGTPDLPLQVPAPTGDLVREGETVLLVDERERYLVTANHGVQRISGLGVVNTVRLIGARLGTKVDLAHRFFYVFRPTVRDHLAVIERGPQVVLLKDAGLMFLQLGIHAGSTVLEIGAGSGNLTILLASLVGPSGRVISYEMREDHAVRVRKNLETARMLDRVTLVIGDGRTGISLPDAALAEAAVIDIPDPWSLLQHLGPVLAPGASIGCILPTVNQIESMVRALRGGDWIDVRAIELLEREMVVGERGVRPSFEMLGHTAYIVTARKVVSKTDPGPRPHAITATKPKHGGSG